ncbi:MAG TPA: MFS transporter [Candidatus Eisenbacteria bacterium]
MRASDPPALDAAPAPASGPRVLTGINRNIAALGVTSLLTDVSTEMIVPTLPLFVTTVLGAPVASLGLIEGVAESTASLLRVASGWLSDRIGRRTPFLMLGYALSTVSKAAMAAAGSWPAILGLRFADRVGKGLRNPPRDALIVDSVEARHRGRAFGFHRAMDTLGATLGPFAAFAVLAAWPGGFRRVFLLSAAPALLALFVLAIFVRAPRRAAAAPAPRPAPRPLAAPYKRFLAVQVVFGLASSSVAFVLLRARDAGFTAQQVPLVYALYNAVYALLAFPAGILSDRIGRRRLMLWAYLLFAGVYALLAWRATPGVVLVALAVLGLHSALLEVARRALVADFAGESGRGTAFGVYDSVVGVTLLPASVAAGALWDRFGARAAFATDAALALIAAALFALLLPARREAADRPHAHAA